MKVTKSAARPLPPDLADVALIDAQACAAPGSMSVSWWYERVKVGAAPQPAVRAPRCTRWRLSQVKAFWIAFAKQAEVDIEAAARIKSRATKASAAAQAKRSAAAAAAVK